ncbi:MAG TPA: hypothetical protein VLA37_10630 [Sphingomonadaceae bacterium]|nr:hypothetical protein [Sphingomonadaceae bacterium]
MGVTPARAGEAAAGVGVGVTGAGGAVFAGGSEVGGGGVVRVGAGAGLGVGEGGGAVTRGAGVSPSITGPCACGVWSGEGGSWKSVIAARSGAASASAVAQPASKASRIVLLDGFG